MVSIPSNQIKNIIYFDHNIEKQKLKKLKSTLKRKSIIQEAENRGYFLNVTSEYLNERFNVKSHYHTLSDNENIQKLRYIRYIDLHQSRIQRLLCLEYCTGVVYLYLANNSISDITSLRSCYRLICLDVSSNVIEVLPDFIFWGGLKSLRILYAHDNPISEPDSVIGLCGCPNLTLLTLSNSPLALKRKYRHFLVNSIWSLKSLDNYLVSDEEIIEDANFKLSRFRSQSADLKFQSHRIYHNQDANDIEANINAFIAEINCLMSHISPVIIIQKWTRGFLCRKKFRNFNRSSQTQKSLTHKMPKLVEETPVVENAVKHSVVTDDTVKDSVKYLTIDLNHLQTTSTIENLDREALLVDSMAPAYNSYTYRSIAKSDQDQCSNGQITRALRKDDDQFTLIPRTMSEIKRCFTFRLMGVNPPSTNMEPSSELAIEKSRSHYVIREADRMFHEHKLSFILPEIKSKPVTKTNSNILFQKSQGCMGLFLLNKWDKTDRAVLDMDLYHERISKVEKIKHERELKLQDLLDGNLRKKSDIKKNHEEHKNIVFQSAKLEKEMQLMRIDDVKSKQDDSMRQRSKIQKEITFSLNFRAKQSAASNAIDRFERMAIKQDQVHANASTVSEIRETMGVKMEGVKSYIENQIANKRMENNLEKSALDVELFQQMNNRMTEAKMRVEKLKTIHRLISCPKLKVVEVNLEPVPASS